MEKVCKNCGKTKSIESFGVNKMYKTGREPNCKICRNTKQRLSRKIKPRKITDRFSLRMGGLQKSDWCKMYKFLEQIGYDVNGDIHKQFVEKHGLVYGKRYYKNVVTYVPQDCINYDVQTEEET